MVRRVKIFFLCLLILAFGAKADAQQVSLKPVYEAGREARYAVTASTETVVAPTGANGLSSVARRELTATILVKTVSVAESEIVQEATIEVIGFRSTVNGAEQNAGAGSLVGKKIEYTIDSSGNLLKCSIPRPAERVAVAELLFNLTRRLASIDVAADKTSEASGQGPFYSDALSEISKNAKTTYKLAGVTDNIATIDGAITLDRKGTSTLTTTEGVKEVSVVAAGSGRTRFEFDTSLGSIVEGTTESRIEGKLSFTAPTAEGQPLQPRDGSLVETAKFSIKLIR